MSDLISRQDAIERATKEHDFYKGATIPTDKARRDELLNVMCWLDELPSAQLEPKWIPCSERLPERADEVLIAYREEYDDWSEEYAVSTATYMPRAGRWDYDHLNITHWMPLPEPPKGEQE